jgi:hypothetical protein
MAKLTIPLAAAVVTLLTCPALACDEAPVVRYTAPPIGATATALSSIGRASVAAPTWPIAQAP